MWPKTLSIAPVQLKSARGMGPQGSSLYRTCATEVTFYRPCAAQIALRRLLEARFEHFWALLPKWLSGGLWRFILTISGPCRPNGFQEALEVHRGSGSSLYRTCVAEVTFYRPSATEGLDIQRRRAKQVQDDIFMRTSCNKRMRPPVD